MQLVLYAPSGLCENYCESRVIDFCRFSARAISDGMMLISLTFAFLLLILLCQTQHLSQHYPPPHHNKVLSTSSSSLALSAGAVEGCYRRLCLFWQCQLSKESSELVGGLRVCVSKHNCWIPCWGYFTTAHHLWNGRGEVNSLGLRSLLCYASQRGEGFRLPQISHALDS